MTDTSTLAGTALAAASTESTAPRATAVRQSVASLMDQVVSAVAAGSYPDGIPADLDQVAKTAAFRAKALRAAG